MGRFNVHNPSLYFVHALREALIRQGVAVDGGVGEMPRDADTSEWEELLVYTSPLRRTLGAMLKHSQNLYAELVLRILGRELGGIGSLKGGIRVLTDTLGQAHVLPPGFVFADGSGLSRDNRVSAGLLAKTLVWCDRVAGTGDELRSLLAEPGQPGTLRRRMARLQGQVFAKTGTMTQISSLAGYVRIAPGRFVAFATVTNHGPASRSKKMEDALCEAIAELDI